MTEQQRREVVEVVAKSPHTVEATVQELGISRSTYYRWRAEFNGQKPSANGRRSWNALRPQEREAIVQQALAQPPIRATLNGPPSGWP